MSIEKIDPRELRFQIGRGRRLSEEASAIRQMEAGEAIKFPCRWEHSSKTNQCPSGSVAYREGRRDGRIYQTTCREGTVYVYRVA